MRHSKLALACVAAAFSFVLGEDPGAWMSQSEGRAAADPAYPAAVISNGPIRAVVYLPDAQRGFYRSTRFDWSGIIASLEYAGHKYYGPWFTKSEPAVRDFVYRDADIVAGAQSSVVGPAEEFPRPQGFEVAPAGGTFLKIGVGVLRKGSEPTYSPYTNYDVVNPGTWTARPTADSVTFVQELTDASSGYGYVYRKTVRLVNGRPEMVIAHSLENTGRLPLETTQYNHNFLTLDGAPTGPDFAIVLPFRIETTRPPASGMAAIRGNEIAYLKTLEGQERVSFPIQGFGASPTDYDVRVENRRTGAGVRITSDRPLASATLWSIRSVISLEPFVDVTTAPGRTTTWTYTYTYCVAGK